ncbi:hypothetical protein ACH5RR_001117 [Cinchona calisaya]|uniref:Uncharacterized protein n=1 Tax=Cinchona calisaya TaxID=153742 RepID=A0ABD3B2R5_9GENT
MLKEVSDYPYCGAKRFEYEPQGFCCSSGEIHLLSIEMTRELMLLYLGNSEEANKFQKCVRSYDNMFVFTSIGMHSNKLSSRRHHGVNTLKVQGQMSHFINQLIPDDGEKPTN